MARPEYPAPSAPVPLVLRRLLEWGYHVAAAGNQVRIHYAGPGQEPDAARPLLAALSGQRVLVLAWIDVRNKLGLCPLCLCRQERPAG